MAESQVSRWYIAASAAAILFFGFLLSQDFLARLAWQRYQRPDLALILARRDAEFTMFLGNYYFGQTLGKSEYDLAKAGKAYQKALVAKPGILWGHYQLGRIAFMKGDFESALGEINAELKTNPENLRSLYVRGLIYGYRGWPGDLEKAAQDFRRFTQWAPKEWAGYNDLAWILSKQGKYQEAGEAIKTAFRQALGSGENPWLWNSLGAAQLNLKGYAAAKSSFEKAKIFADKLTAEEWRGAYPGNNPADTASGLEAFRRAVEENLRRAAGENQL